MSRTNGWTEERRTRQRELIRNWKPWEKSTGPKTRQGKRRVAQNACKGGVRPMLRLVTQVLRDQEKCLDRL